MLIKMLITALWNCQTIWFILSPLYLLESSYKELMFTSEWCMLFSICFCTEIYNAMQVNSKKLKTHFTNLNIFEDWINFFQVMWEEWHYFIINNQHFKLNMIRNDGRDKKAKAIHLTALPYLPAEKNVLLSTKRCIKWKLLLAT